MYLDSTKRIQTMVLIKDEVLAEGSKVLIVDDFMKAGGTVNGMISLLRGVSGTMLLGIAVLS